MDNREHPRPGLPQPPQPGPLWLDDAAAVVQRGDVSDAWLQRVEKFATAHGLGAGSVGGAGPKFSHAWVVGGSRTTTGAAVLVSDPQPPVRNPSLWMEFHLSGQTFNARGVGVPGSPGLLIGFNRHVAWGLTAMGADQADLFRLQTDPQHPNEYRWNGQWRKMDVRTERIKVKRGADIELTVRKTHLGPVVSEFCFRQPGDPEVTLKRIPLNDVDASQTICPIGHSDRPDSPYRTSTMALWGGAKLHAAPLSHAAVEKMAVETVVLSR